MMQYKSVEKLLPQVLLKQENLFQRSGENQDAQSLEKKSDGLDRERSQHEELDRSNKKWYKPAVLVAALALFAVLGLFGVQRLADPKPLGQGLSQEARTPFPSTAAPTNSANSSTPLHSTYNLTPIPTTAASTNSTNPSVRNLYNVAPSNATYSPTPFPSTVASTNSTNSSTPFPDAPLATNSTNSSAPSNSTYYPTPFPTTGASTNSTNSSTLFPNTHAATNSTNSSALFPSPATLQ